MGRVAADSVSGSRVKAENNAPAWGSFLKSPSVIGHGQKKYFRPLT